MYYQSRISLASKSARVACSSLHRIPIVELQDMLVAVDVVCLDCSGIQYQALQRNFETTLPLWPLFARKM